jgi:hypothetical protein
MPYSPLRKSMVELAKEYLDLETNEHPPGSNRGEIVSRIIRSEGGTPGQPWCNFFWRRLNRRARAYNNLPQLYRKGGSTQELVNEATERQKLTTKPLPGDAVCVKGNAYPPSHYNHTAMFVDWVDPMRTRYWVIEGNAGDSVRMSQYESAKAVTFVSAE